MQDKAPILDYETCEYIGYEAENAVFFNLKKKLNDRHPANNGISYFDNLALNIYETEGLISDCDTPIKVEIVDLLKEEFRNMDKLNQHCLFIYLGSSEKEENEMIQDLAWHFEETLMDRADEILASSNDS